MSDPKVLVACPTYAGMGYALERWANAYHAFTYENKGSLMVDNSDENLHYTHLIRAQGIDAIYQDHRFKFLWDTLELSWRIIVEFAHDNEYDFIFSLEADVIAPPNAIEVMLKASEEGGKNGKPAIVTHRYHPRGVTNKDSWFDTLGCSIFPTHLLYNARNRWMAIAEIEFFLLALDNGYERVRAKDLLELDHLLDEESHSKYAFPLPAKERHAMRSANALPPGATEDWHGRRTE